MDTVWSDNIVLRDSRLKNSEIHHNERRYADFEESETDDSTDSDTDDSSDYSRDYTLDDPGDDSDIDTTCRFTPVSELNDYTTNDFTGRRWPATNVFDDNIFESERKSYTRSSLPVGHVRLVRLLSDETERVIRCETRVFPMSQFFRRRVYGDPHQSSSRINSLKNDPNSYTAISYTWGSTIVQHGILLDGQPHLLPKNLWRFLRHAIQIRERIPGWFWIDALSIDQNNARERMHQVALLSEIFGRAERVVAWLGPAYEDSDSAMFSLSMPWGYISGDCVRKICERRYWRRLWVVQELHFARQLYFMCGRMLCMWNHPFENSRAPYLRLPESSPAGILAKLSNPRSRDAPMLRLLRMTKDLQCSDARDRIYALVSLLSNDCEKVDADYTISTSNLARIVLRNMPGEGESQPSIWSLLKKALSLTDSDLDLEMMVDIQRIKWEGRERPHDLRLLWENLAYDTELGIVVVS